MLETFFMCFAFFLVFCIAWFTPKAGTAEIQKPLGKQFAVIAFISCFPGIGLSLLTGVFPF